LKSGGAEKLLGLGNSFVLDVGHGARGSRAHTEEPAGGCRKRGEDNDHDGPDNATTAGVAFA
jgi:hypothetical protein